MPGRYYLKHIINHMVDNQARKDRHTNQNYASTINYAVDYLKTTTDDYEKKIAYLRELFPVGSRNAEFYIGNCIRGAKDKDLYFAFFGRTLEHDNKINKFVGIALFIFIVFACYAIVVLK